MSFTISVAFVASLNPSQKTMRISPAYRYLAALPLAIMLLLPAQAQAQAGTKAERPPDLLENIRAVGPALIIPDSTGSYLTKIADDADLTYPFLIRNQGRAGSLAGLAFTINKAYDLNPNDLSVHLGGVVLSAKEGSSQAVLSVETGVEVGKTYSANKVVFEREGSGLKLCASGPLFEASPGGTYQVGVARAGTAPLSKVVEVGGCLSVYSFEPKTLRMLRTGFGSAEGRYEMQLEGQVGSGEAFEIRVLGAPGEQASARQVELQVSTIAPEWVFITSLPAWHEKLPLKK